MTYTIDRVLNGLDLDEADHRTRAALSQYGFGVLIEIDVSATMKKKLDRDMPGYRILGACAPTYAWAALAAEPKIGAMLPCNVVLREVEGGVEISAVDPIASMQAIDNVALNTVATEVYELLTQVIAAV